MVDLKKLQNKINYRFIKDGLLVLALTHKSVSSAKNNERLEFLGDSILNMVIAKELYHRFPNQKEGELTRMRAKLVRGDTLSEVAREFEFGDFIKMSPAELRTGGAQRSSILADTLEAIIGAIYLDDGFEVCKSCIVEWFGSRLEDPELIKQLKDFKTELQEFLQARKMELPEYKIESVEGEAHEQVFKMSCQIKGVPVITYGTDTTRRRAETKAAEEMFEKISKEL